MKLLEQFGDVLDLHVPGASDAVLGDLGSEEREELGALMHLGGQLQKALAPVCPSSVFRDGLRDNLARLASERQSREVVIDLRPRPRELVIGAAIGSVVALAGGIAYFIRARSQAQS